MAVAAIGVVIGYTIDDIIPIVFESIEWNNQIYTWRDFWCIPEDLKEKIIEWFHNPRLTFSYQLHHDIQIVNSDIVNRENNRIQVTLWNGFYTLLIMGEGDDELNVNLVDIRDVTDWQHNLFIENRSISVDWRLRLFEW